MKPKRKSYILRYIVAGLVLLCMLGIFFLSKEDRFYVMYPAAFAVITAFFDGTIRSDWLEKRAEKRAKNPLID